MKGEWQVFDKGITIEELNRRYQEGKTNLSRHFAELRANILLDSGYHHNRRSRLRDGRIDKTQQKRIKFTKNHTQVIGRHIENNILNANPGCGFFARHERELQHQKAAELTTSVWEFQREKVCENQKRVELCHDFVVCGELFLKVAWDVNAGRFLGYEQPAEPMYMINDDGEEEEVYQEPVAKWTGKLVWERIYPFDVITDPNSRSWDDCRYVTIRKLIPVADLKSQYAFDEEKLEYITDASTDETYQIFDGLTGQYSEAKEHCLVLETYIKPCINYKNGYYIYYTHEGILEEGELPVDGEGNPLPFPILYCGYDQSNTSVRSFSFIKQTKALQMEINRAASAVVMESLVLGHTTVLTQSGSKLSSAGIGNGMKALTYTGTKPEISRGVNGDQYMQYIDTLTKEMYELAGVPYREQDKAPYSQDVMGLLFRSLKDKKRFSYYAEKFERMLCEATELSIALCREYLDEDEIIPLVGKNEIVNISEFKNTKPFDTIVKIRPRSDDYLSMLGKSIQVSQILQYAGKSLSAQDVGVLARNLPFLNDELIIEDSVLDYDTATNTILALDRGEIPIISDAEDHRYMIKRLTSRMKKADFQMLNDEIKKNYQDRLDKHNEFFISQQQEAAMATAGFIPSGGGLIAIDMYVEDEKGKQRRWRVPSESLHWLRGKLMQQGTQVQDQESLPLSEQAAIGRGMHELSQQSAM